MTDPRAALRRHFITTRETLEANVRRDAERRIIDHLNRHQSLRSARTIAAFIGTRGEVDLTSFLNAQAATIQIALPVVGDEKGTMEFHRYDPAAGLTTNRYGILEPAGDTCTVSAGEIETMLMPLVAFDSRGNRLGMGGGYYDRFLAGHSRRPYLLGVAFACQQADALAAEAWDVRLDAVVTEDGVLEFS